MPRGIRRRLENLRESDNLRELNHSHGAASTLHKVQSNAKKASITRQSENLKRKFLSVSSRFAAIRKRGDLLRAECRYQHERRGFSRIFTDRRASRCS